MYQRILVPVDGSAHSKRALDEAIAVARLTGGRLVVVHAIDEPFLAMGTGAWVGGNDLLAYVREGAEAVLAEAVDTARRAGVPVESRLLDTFAGRVCDLVAQCAADAQADLIVIGTHGRRGVGRALMGSDAEQILRLSPVPVLLVRAQPSAAGTVAS
jgi:nucleotide-binding universal stress UspA family protein